MLDPWAQNLLPKYAQFTIIKAFKSTETTNKSNQIPTQNVTRRGRTFYSPEDDKLIIDQVRLNGDVRKTHVKIGKMLGLKDPYNGSIEQRYIIHLSSQIFVKAKFSLDEDKIIREHVDQHGKDQKSLKKLAEILNRGSTDSIRRRHDLLMSENEYLTSSVRTAWKVEEEGILIQKIFKILNLKGIRNHQDINLIENISENKFSECAEVLKRSNSSCHSHWMGIIAPALKTHFLGLPLNGDWKLDMMSYIVRNKIKHEKELDVGFLVDKIAPGQTKASLFAFEKRLRRYELNEIVKKRELPLHEVVNNKLRKQSQRNPCFNKNHKGEK